VRGGQERGPPGAANREVPVAAVHRGPVLHRQGGQGDAASRDGAQLQGVVRGEVGPPARGRVPVRRRHRGGGRAGGAPEGGREVTHGDRDVNQDRAVCRRHAGAGRGGRAG